MWTKSAVPMLLVLITGCSGVPARLGDGTPSLKTAETALASGSPDMAYRICGSLIDAGDRSVKTMVCKANALTALGRSAEAASSFAIALQSQPNSPDALIGMGRLRLATDPGGAEQLFMQALSVQPRDSVALNNLGIARDLQGRHRDAQSAYAEAMAANPDSYAPQVNLALSMAMSGRAGEATRILRPLAVATNAGPRERHDYAAVLTMAGRPDEATQFLSPELSAPQVQEALQGYRSMPAAEFIAPQPAVMAKPNAQVSRAEPVQLAAVAVAVSADSVSGTAEPIKLRPVVATPAVQVAVAPAVEPTTPVRIVVPTPVAAELTAETPSAPIRLAPLTDAPPPRAPVP